MHRVESANNDNGLYTNGPPGTALGADALNALQEEICNVIEQSGLTLKTAATETRTQLWEALVSLGFNRNEHRARFIFINSSPFDKIYIDPGRYLLCGDTTRTVYWDSRLCYTFDSDIPLTADQYYYLYLDDSAIASTGVNLITANELIDSTTPPIWSDSKHGWYNSNDRCIFAVKTSSGDKDILEFYHDGGTLMEFTEQIGLEYQAALSTTWQDVTLKLPAFVSMGHVVFRSTYVDAEVYLEYRPKGASTAVSLGPREVGYSAVGATQSIQTVPTLTDSSQRIQIVHSAATTNTATVQTCGWYFPVGM